MSLSVSKIVQSKAIALDNNCKTTIHKIGCRSISVVLKGSALLLDVPLNIFVGAIKISVGVFVVAPINFTAKLIGKKGIETNWTVKQGCYHLGLSGLYVLDFFIQPVTNLILGPCIYLRTGSTTFADAFVDHNCKDMNGHTPLFYAIDKGNNEAVKKLIKAGAKVNTTDNWRNTPLLYAVSKNNFEASKLLIDAGADVNVKNLANITPMNANMVYENSQITDTLIDAGADVNERLADGAPLLVASITNSKFGTTKKLLDRNANIDATYRGMNASYAFKYAYKTNNASIDERVVSALRTTSVEKQTKLLKLIGHIAEIPGSCRLGENEVDFEYSLNGKLIPKQLQKNIRRFALENPSLSNNILECLVEALELNTGATKPSLEDLLARHAQNKPIIVNSGCIGHAMQCVLWENYFFLCDRGQQPAGQQRLQVFRISSSQSIPDLITQFRSCETLPKEHVTNAFQQLISSMAIQYQITTLQNFTLPAQTRETCGYASYEDAIYVIWQIARLREHYGNTSIEDVIRQLQLFVPFNSRSVLEDVRRNFYSFRAAQMRGYLDRLDVRNIPMLSPSQRQHVERSIREAENIALNPA